MPSIEVERVVPISNIRTAPPHIPTPQSSAASPSPSIKTTFPAPRLTLSPSPPVHISPLTNVSIKNRNPTAMVNPIDVLSLHPPSSASLPRALRRSLQKSLQTQPRRCYALPAPKKPSRVEEELKRQARAAAKDGKAHGMSFFNLSPGGLYADQAAQSFPGG